MPSMTGPLRNLRYLKAHCTRERILDISLELFTAQGYEKTSLREITDSSRY